VERSNRTHNEEFSELAHGQPSLAALNHQLRNWENTYNCVRPQQALGHLTPQEFLLQWMSKRQTVNHLLDEYKKLLREPVRE
jgi:transposase InsO family protein